MSGRPDRWSHEQLIGCCQRPVTYHRTRPVVVSPLWNLSVLDRTLLPFVRSVCHQRLVQHPVTADDAYLPSLFIGAFGPASGRFCQHLVQRPVTSVSSFLRNLAYGLVPILVLGLCLISWVFSCAPRVLLVVLIIGSSRRLRSSHVLHPIELQNNYLQIY